MNPIRPHVEPAPSASVRSHDILYVLFRRRWSIILLSLLGIGGGVAVFFLSKPTYESEAELLIKYVVDSKAVGTDGSITTVSTPGGSGGDAILASEMAILTSLDLARIVARTVGSTNIVPKADANRDIELAAAFAINRGLKVTVPPKSSILRLNFRHRESSLPQVVLSNVVVHYLEMHNRIHRTEGIVEDLNVELEKHRGRLREITANLQRIESELGVASLEDARRSSRDQIARIRGEVFTTEALLAEKRASLSTLSALVGKSTNAPSGAATNLANIPTSRLEEYRKLRLQIDDLSRKEQGLLIEYTEVSPFVKAVRGSLSRLIQERNRLENEFPALTSAEAVLARPGEAPGNATSERMTAATLDVPALEAKLRTLNSQLELLKTEALRLDERSEEIREYTRQREIEEKSITSLASAKNQAAIDNELNRNSTPNIRITQQPTPAALATSTTIKLAAGLAGGGILFALTLAFGLEWYLDQSIRRRSQVESGLKIPLFLTIPRLRLPRRRSRAALPPKSRPAAALPPQTGSSRPADIPSPAVPAPLAVRNYGANYPATGSEADLGTWVEALRDRLIMHFETNDVTHKPKLIGLTSCGHGAGVTTVAAALAASLSETGDGRVLYVDMNPQRGGGVAMHPFHRGESQVALSQAFENEGREAAQVQDNLYVVTISEPGSRRVGVVPRALAALMPKIKASDYDYIIFDCPPISQTSVTSKVAGLLDITFLVIDSERTQADLAKNALTLMGEGRAKVTAVLNKHRRYLPRRFDPDI